MKNKSNQHRLLTEFLKKPENSNIKAEKIIRKDAPDGYLIDIDSLNESQCDYIKNLPKD